MSRSKLFVIIFAILFLSAPFVKNFFEGRKSPLATPTQAEIKAHQQAQFTTFDNLVGPKEKSIIPTLVPTNIKDYESDNTSRMAVLITDQNSKWLDLIKGFKSIGIPIAVTTDYKKALRHKVVFIYPYISGGVLTGEALKALVDFPRTGGTLLAVNVLGGGLQDTFGFETIKEGQNNKKMILSKAFTDIITPKGKVTDENEKSFFLARLKPNSALVSTYYESPEFAPLATYDTGEAAIVENHTEKGSTYAFGIDLGQLFFLGYSAREDDIARTYVNHYEPTIDIFLRFIKEIYFKKEPNALAIGTVPEGKELSIILSHDVDYAFSVQNSLLYTELEKSYNVKATYFLQVKYLKDFNDKIFFDDTNIKKIDQVFSSGMEIGSHSISHSRQYSQFPQGDGTEQYPTYKPFVIDRLHTRDGTVLGELRVSKFLIESKTLEKDVISFRPGELSNPFTLPESLLATGYKYSSSVTANNSLTHLPFQLSYSREAQQALPVYEFPVTIEDEEYPNMIKQVPEALQVSEAIATYGGVFVILIHPNVPGHKLEFEKQVIEHWKDRAWFGTMREIGDWWAARDLLQVDADRNTVTIDSQKPMPSLVLELSKAKKIQSTEPQNLDVTLSGKKLFIKNLEGKAKIIFK